MIGHESQSNFTTMMRAAKNGDISVVSCEDAKGRSFEVLCVVAQTPDEEYAYLPFGLMLSPPLYKFMNKLSPPKRLKGEWIWDDED
ncbi:MAG: hypothetical protein CMH52_14320 [Myxococcales bacterium]|nr:hypothetical protein [Myxococcales bacterium]